MITEDKYDETYKIYGDEEVYHCLEYGLTDPFYCYENFIVMQSTSLKDKNGKLIYEGDILGGIYENLYIHYCKNCMQFQLKAKGYGCMACCGDIHWCELVEDKNIEVIGNIYESPELLESN